MDRSIHRHTSIQNIIQINERDRGERVRERERERVGES